MIQTEIYMTRDDGVTLVRTWSDDDRYIERDGVRYAEAIDPEETGRTYTETDEMFAGWPFDADDQVDEPEDEPTEDGDEETPGE